VLKLSMHGCFCRWVHPLIWAFVGVFVLWAGFIHVIGWMEQATYDGAPLIEIMRDVRPPHRDIVVAISGSHTQP
jgi:hypothetical protein